MKNTLLLIFSVFFFHFLSRNKFIKFRQQNKKFKIARKINNVKNKNFEFYINNEIDTHIVYNKSLFNKIKLLKYNKQIKMFNEIYVDIKKIEFIIMNLKIKDKKIINTIIEMKYVFDIQYNFISTNLLYRKNYKIKQNDEFYILTNTKTNDIFVRYRVEIRNFIVITRES